MFIYTEGFDFECPVCKIKAAAQTASDVHAVKCNHNIEYFVICPNCGTKIAVKSEEIPAHIKNHIKFEGCGIMTYHD